MGGGFHRPYSLRMIGSESRARLRPRTGGCGDEDGT